MVGRLERRERAKQGGTNGMGQDRLLRSTRNNFDESLASFLDFLIDEFLGVVIGPAED